LMLSTAAAASLLVACDRCHEPESADSALPHPQLVENHAFENTPLVYYLPWDEFQRAEPTAAADSLLHGLLNSAVLLKNAWFPTAPSPCEAPGAMTAAIIELKVSDSRVRDFGFRDDPEPWWIINCGVPTLWLDSFP